MCACRTQPPSSLPGTMQGTLTLGLFRREQSATKMKDFGLCRRGAGFNSHISPLCFFLFHPFRVFLLFSAMRLRLALLFALPCFAFLKSVVSASRGRTMGWLMGVLVACCTASLIVECNGAPNAQSKCDVCVLVFPVAVY